MTRSKAFDKKAWQEGQEAKLDAAQAALDAGLKALVTSDDWRRMLESMAVLGRFSIRRYSFTNMLLLLSQRPNIARAGTFKAWQAAGRSVRKGEKALMVLAPRLRPVTEDERQSAAGPGWDVHEQLKRRKRIVGFRALSVFALEQTDGPELSEFALPSLDLEEVFEDSVETLRRVALAIEGAPVSAIELRARRVGEGSAAGWYERLTRRIVVMTGETSRAEQFSTLCHEVAHALLHGVEDRHTRPECEVEAESVAFVVCHALGLPTGERAFPYVAAWARGADSLGMVAKSGERIRAASRTILDALAPEVGEELELAAA